MRTLPVGKYVRFLYKIWSERGHQIVEEDGFVVAWTGGSRFVLSSSPDRMTEPAVYEQLQIKEWLQ